MVRTRFHQTVALGRFNDALKWARDMNADAKKNGWAESRLISPAFGAVNQLIIETEYPDLAAMDKETTEFYANAEAMATFRKGIELNAPGTHPWDELELEVPGELA